MRRIRLIKPVGTEVGVRLPVGTLLDIADDTAMRLVVGKFAVEMQEPIPLPGGDYGGGAYHPTVNVTPDPGFDDGTELPADEPADESADSDDA